MDLVYQNEIPEPPISLEQLYEMSCSGDRVTVKSWKDIWIKNYKAAVERFGELGEKSYGKLHGCNRYLPAVVIGSGPSLKYSLGALRENQAAEHPLMTVSCLHNLGLFQDEGIKIDYYLSLDSGGVVIEDVSEARNKDGGFYWDETKGQKLIAFAASDPRLFDVWKGEIYLFNCLLPDITVRSELNGIQRFAHYISSGGNAGGACMYFAKAVAGSSTILYVGFDFCFDYDNTFHAYATQYDKPGEYVLATDVFGNKRKTWPSYLNFKYFLDTIAIRIPGEWINCSEGLLGAYPQGNIRHYRYMSLTDALARYLIADRFYVEQKELATGKRLSISEIKFRELYGNPKYGEDLTLF